MANEDEIFLSIVIPAYNEENRISFTLEATIAYLRQQIYRSEIIVVSDGSTDNTVGVVKNFLSKFHNLRIIEYFPNKGKGRAVKEGMLAAKGKYVLFMDADYSVPIETLEMALGYMKEGYAIAIGSRALPGANIVRGQSPLRMFAGKVYGRIQNIWLVQNFSDTQCGFKLFTREAVNSLFPLQKLDSVIFDGEILFLASKKGFKIKEFPVTWYHDPKSRIRYKCNLIKWIKIFWELFKVRWFHLNVAEYHRG